MLVTGGYDTSIRLFDATNQTLIRRIQFCDQQVLRVAFSSDSPVSHDAPLFLIAGGSPTVAVYDVTHSETSPTLFQVHQGHTEAITAVGFEPRHSAFAYSASEDGTLQTWKPQLSHHHHQHVGLQPMIHPMGNGINLFNDCVPCTIRNTGNKNKHNGGITNMNNCVPIHDAIYYPPKNYFFTVDANGRFRVWNHCKGQVDVPLLSVVPHASKRNIQCIELSTDYTTVVMANFDGFVFLYQVEHILSAIQHNNASHHHQQQQQQPPLHNHSSGVVTEPPTGSTFPVVPIVFRGNQQYIPRLRLSVSGALLVCTTSSGAIKLFRMADIVSHANHHQHYPHHHQNHEYYEHSEDDQYATITPLREFTGQRGWIWDAAFVEDRDDYLFTCSSNMQVMLWSLNDLQNSTEYSGHNKGVVCLAVRERMSPDVPPEQFGPPPSYDYMSSQNASPPDENPQVGNAADAYPPGNDSTQQQPPH